MNAADCDTGNKLISSEFQPIIVMIKAFSEHKKVFNLGHIKSKLKEWLTHNEDYQSNKIKEIFNNYDSLSDHF